MSNRSGSHCGCFRDSVSNTDEHEDTKYKVFRWLRKKGYTVMTEVIFNNGKRADVLDITNGVVYEILKSETLKECKEKVKAYPNELEVRYVDANKPFDEYTIGGSSDEKETKQCR